MFSWKLRGVVIAELEGETRLVLSPSAIGSNAMSAGYSQPLIDGEVLQFSLTINDTENHLSSEPAFLNVTLSTDSEIPLITFQTPSIVPALTKSLAVRIIHSPCVRVDPNSAASFEYAWNLTDVLDGVQILDLSDYNSSLIAYIPIGTLVPSREYRIDFRANMSPIYPRVLSVSRTFTVANLSVVASLSAGATLSLPKSTTFALDASSSFDPASLIDTRAEYIWSCLRMKDQADCTSLLSSSSSVSSKANTAKTLALNGNERVVIDTGSDFVAGESYLLRLVFVVIHTPTSTRRTSSTSTLITVAQAPKPTVQVIQAVGGGAIARGKRVRLVCNASPHPLSPSSVQDLSFLWSSLTSQLVLDDKVVLSFSGVRSRNLVLDTSNIPGGVYILRVAVTDPGAAASPITTDVNVTITISEGPSLRSVVINPPGGGVAFSTEFAIDCVVSAQEEASLLYSYELIRLSDNGRGNVSSFIGIPSVSSLYAHLVLEAGVYVVKATVTDSRGSSATAMSAAFNVTSEPSQLVHQTEYCAIFHATKLTVNRSVSSTGIYVDSKASILDLLDLLSESSSYSRAYDASQKVLEFLKMTEQEPNEGTAEQHPCLAPNFRTVADLSSALRQFILGFIVQITSQRGLLASTKAQTVVLIETFLQSGRNRTDVALSSSMKAMVDDLDESEAGGEVGSSLGRSLSGIASSLDLSAMDFEPIAELVVSVLKTAAMNHLEGEPPVELSAPLFRGTCEVVENRSIQASSSATAVDLSNSGVDSALASHLEWHVGSPKYLAERVGGQLLSPILDIRLFQKPAQRSFAAPLRLQLVRNFAGVVSIFLPWVNSKNMSARNQAVECGFFNRSTQQWSTRGCKTSNVSDRGVGCVCNHLTEFAIIQRERDNVNTDEKFELVPEHVRITYMTFFGIFSFTCSYILYQLRRIHRGSELWSWTGFAHFLLTTQTLTRALSCLYFGGHIIGFRYRDTPASLLFVISALPYTILFLSTSLVPFLWMVIVHNKQLKKQPWRPYLKCFIILNAAITGLVWMTFAILWHLDVQNAALIGSSLLGGLCMILMVIYSIYGCMLRKHLLIMSDGSEERNKIPNMLLWIIPINIVCFLGLTITWIVSGILASDNDIALGVVVPVQLLFETAIVGVTLYMYHTKVAKLSSSRSTKDSKSNGSAGRTTDLTVPRSTQPRIFAKFAPINSNLDLLSQSHSRRQTHVRQRNSLSRTVHISEIQHAAQKPSTRRQSYVHARNSTMDTTVPPDSIHRQPTYRQNSFARGHVGMRLPMMVD